MKSYVPYTDMAVSSQTRKARIVFEENSGLTAVEGVDAILQTIKLAKRRIRARVATARYRARGSTTTNNPVPPSAPAPTAGPGAPARDARRR